MMKQQKPTAEKEYNNRNKNSKVGLYVHSPLRPMLVWWKDKILSVGDGCIILLRVQIGIPRPPPARSPQNATKSDN
jgi:hypothetical protein